MSTWSIVGREMMDKDLIRDSLSLCVRIVVVFTALCLALKRKSKTDVAGDSGAAQGLRVDIRVHWVSDLPGQHFIHVSRRFARSYWGLKFVSIRLRIVFDNMNVKPMAGTQCSGESKFVVKLILIVILMIRRLPKNDPHF